MKKLITRLSRYYSFEKLRNMSGVKLIIPCYHTVSDDALPHLKGLYRYKNIKKFKEDIDFLALHYTPLTLEQVIASANDEFEIKKPSVLLTFDDGLREFADVIAPILTEKGIPAACFLNTAFLDNRDMFYRFKAALLCRFDDEADLKKVSEIVGHKVYSLKNLLLSRTDFSKRAWLEPLAELFHFNFSDFLKQQKPYLTTEEVKNLMQKGFEFGSHSHEHPEFSYISLDEQIEQVEKSLNILKGIGVNKKAFSFPFTDYGVRLDFFVWAFHPDNPILDITFGGGKMKLDMCPMNFARLPFEYTTKNANDYLKEEYFLHKIKRILRKDMALRDW